MSEEDEEEEKKNLTVLHALKAFYMQFYKHARFMEVSVTKLCYKLQHHVLGIKMGLEDIGVKFELKF